MATIAKFYFHAAATTNSGIMPSGAFTLGGDTNGGAAGYQTNLKADDTIGVLQTDDHFTSNADLNLQAWGYRRFVSAPLSAHTFAAADGNWTFSYARKESSLLHNQGVNCKILFWRPSTGLRVGTGQVAFAGNEPLSTAEEAESITQPLANTTSILDGDIIVFEVSDIFVQGMNTAYTSTFYYDGTTEGSATSCATFVTPPAALDLMFVAPVASHPPPHLPFV